MQFAPSGTSALNSVDLIHQGTTDPPAFPLASGDLPDDLPRDAQFAGDAGKEAPVKEGPPKFGPARASINLAYFGSHTVAQYSATESMSTTKAITPEQLQLGSRIRALRESLGERPNEFVRHFLGRGRGAMGTPALSNWETGYARPGAENLIIMGNIARDSEQRLYFWRQAGVDLSLLASAAQEFAKNGRPPKERVGARRAG